MFSARRGKLVAARQRDVLHRQHDGVAFAASAAGSARASAPNAAAMRASAALEAGVAAEQVDRHHAAVGEQARQSR